MGQQIWMENRPAFRLIPVLKVVVESRMKVDDKYIENPGHAHAILKRFIGNTDRETLVVMNLNTKNQAIGLSVVSVGDLSSSIVHPREVFKTAGFTNAAAIILGHNHPSGDSTPSAEDYMVTKRLQEAGEIFGVTVLDHIVIGDNTYTSIKAETTFDKNHQGTISYDRWTLTSPAPKPQRPSSLYPSI